MESGKFDKTFRDNLNQSSTQAIDSEPMMAVADISDWDSDAYIERRDAIKLEKNDKGELLTPGGGVSNIQNPTLWRTIRTKEFLNWFGDWINTLRKRKLLNSPKVQITTSETGRTKLYEQARKLYQGQVVFNPDFGKDITITKKSLKHIKSVSTDIRKAQSLEKVADIIKNGVYLGAEPNRKPNQSILQYHRLATQVDLNGDKVVVESVIRETSSGELLYDFNLTEIKDLVGISGAASQKRSAVQPSTKPFINSLLQKLLDFNQNNVSKVVDSNGEPLIVYHGTNADFDIFKDKSDTFYKDELGWGIQREAGYYFTKDSSYASGYATQFSDTVNNSSLIPAFLNIRNPNTYKPSVAVKGQLRSADIAREKLLNNVDGIIERSEIIAFNPNQIKSIFNRSSYSSEQDSMMMSVANNWQFDENNLNLIDEQGKINYEQLEKISDGIERGSIQITRLDGKEERGRIEGGRRNVEASILLGGSERARTKKTETSSRLGWDDHKKAVKHQEDILEQYAKDKDIWFEYNELASNFPLLGRGSESEVFFDKSNNTVIKANGYDFVERQPPFDFIDNRIAVHNSLFPDTKYELIGFTRDDSNYFRFVLRQPYIKESELTTQTERETHLKDNYNLVPSEKIKTKFLNERYIVDDVRELNVIKSENGFLHFIDPIVSINKRTAEVQPFSLKKVDNEPLPKIASDESLQQLADLRKYTFDEILPFVESRVIDGEVELSEGSSEFIRRLLVQSNAMFESSFKGLFIPKTAFNNLIAEVNKGLRTDVLLNVFDNYLGQKVFGWLFLFLFCHKICLYF